MIWNLFLATTRSTVQLHTFCAQQVPSPSREGGLMQSLFSMFNAKLYVPRTLNYLHIYCTVCNQKLGDCNVCLSLQDAYPPPQGGINKRSGRRGEGGKRKGDFLLRSK